MSIVLAGNESASYTPPDLFAGEADIVTNAYTVAVSQTLTQYQVIALNDSQQIVPWDPTALDGTEFAIGIMCFAVTTGAAENPVVPVYVGGYFNTDALDWGTATDAQIEIAFINTNITHRALSGA